MKYGGIISTNDCDGTGRCYGVLPGTRRLHAYLHDTVPWYSYWHHSAIRIPTHVLIAVLTLMLASLVVLSPKLSQNPQAAVGILSQFPFQGRLTNTDGTVVSDSNYDAVFQLYTVPVAGAAVWTESHTGANQVSTVDGIFSTMLGSITTLTGIDFNQDEYWLGITVGADAEMTPRIRLGAAPYAFNGDRLDGLTSADFLILDGQLGGQIAYGGTNFFESLTLRSNTTAFPGYVVLADDSGRVTIGDAAPPVPIAKLIVSNEAGNTTLETMHVRGIELQTADLQHWQRMEPGPSPIDVARLDIAGNLVLADHASDTNEIQIGPGPSYDYARLNLKQNLSGGANIFLQGSANVGGIATATSIYFGDGKRAGAAITSTPYDPSTTLGGDIVFKTTDDVTTLALQNRMTIQEDGRVRINTTTATGLLHVYNGSVGGEPTLSVSGPSSTTAFVTDFGTLEVLNSNATVGNMGSIYFSRDAGYPYAAISAVTTDADSLGAQSGELQFLTVTNGSTNQVMRLTDDGNVGIGTTNPTSFTLQVAGHIGPNVDDTYDLGSSSLRWRDIYLGPTSLHLATTAAETSTARDWKLNVDETNGATDGDLRIQEGSSTRLTIGTTGSVAIGSAGSGHLSIPGSGTDSEQFGLGASAAGLNSLAVGRSASASGNFGVAIGTASTAIGTTTSSISLGHSADALSEAAIAIGHDAQSTGSSLAIGALSSAAYQSLSFGTGSSTSAVNSIAIGTSSVVTSTNVFGVGSSGSPILHYYLGHGQSTAGILGSVDINPSQSTGTNATGSALVLGGGISTGSALGGSVIIQTAPAGASGATPNALVTRFIIDSTGNITFGGNMTASTGDFYDTSIPAAVSATALCISGGGQIGTCSSDARLKQNISNIGAGMSIIEQLSPKTYDYISGQTGQSGFIAQDVQTILPGLVSRNTGDDFLSLNYDGILAYAVKAIQELDQNIRVIDASRDGKADRLSLSSLETRSLVVNEHTKLVGELFVGGGVELTSTLLVKDTATFEKDVTIGGNLTVTGSILGSTQTRGIDVVVPEGATELEITELKLPEDTTYALSILPSWLTTTATIEKTADSFKIQFAMPAPKDATIDYLIQR